ncbi:triose-phosphate isomerase [Rubricoccus marinus]|uniref:Triosephosphate isomerase n=1 Tax=Rubricoccus marinus TaxID=716817 RepID=A0A259TZ35_9BACT|nr:triose-phosphate isomerase [Rubricoccus marinus]OZC02834.1 triose-phosphate isomerase [Rubricoccus marinus]
MLVVGNWKMNTSHAEAIALAADVVRETEGIAGKAGVGVCPPFVWLDAVAERVRGTQVALGAQNVAAEASGAFTGETSAPMLSDLGCTYAIVGHSERRALFGETDADVAARARGAMAHGLVPIVCVGETLEERKSGDAEAVVRRQLEGSLDGLDVASDDALVIAYEPVWAIGTGETASPEQAQDMHATIRAALRQRLGDLASGVQILYGGSVKPGNAATLFAQEDVDGGLVGGASLDAAGFAAIVRAAAEAA